MRPVVSRLHHGLARDPPLGRAHQRVGVAMPVRKDQVAVPGNQRVDALDLHQLGRAALDIAAFGAFRNAGMGQADHHVGPHPPQIGHPGAGGFGHRARLDAALQMLAVPFHHFGRGQAQEADLQVMHAARAIGQPALDQREGRHERVVIQRNAAARRQHVGRNHREPRHGQRAAQQAQAEVELVVAQRGHVIAQRVHRRDHRMPAPPPRRGGQVGQRRALQEISVVDQQGLRVLGPRGGNQACRLGQALPEKRAVRGIIVGKDVRVQIACCQNPQAQVFALGTTVPAGPPSGPRTRYPGLPRDGIGGRGNRRPLRVHRGQHQPGSGLPLAHHPLPRRGDRRPCAGNGINMAIRLNLPGDQSVTETSRWTSGV